LATRAEEIDARDAACRTFQADVTPREGPPIKGIRLRAEVHSLRKPDPGPAAPNDIEIIGGSGIVFPSEMFVPLSGLLIGALVRKGYDEQEAAGLAPVFAAVCDAHQKLNAPDKYIPGADAHEAYSARGAAFVETLVDSIALMAPPGAGAFAYVSKPSVTLPPDGQIEKYADRKDRRETSLAFFARVWGRYVRSGAAYQPDVNRADPGLLPKVRSYCHDHGINAAAILPPTSYERVRRSIRISPELAAAAVRDHQRKRRATQRRLRPL
jgi:hypothetical protein